MKNKKIFPVVALCLAACLIVSVRYSKKAASDSTDSVIDASQSSAVSSDSALSDDSAESPYASDLSNAPSVEDYPVTEETKSEGLNVVPGTIVDLAPGAIAGELNKVYDVPASDPRLAIEMKSIAPATPEQMTSDQEADKVVRVTYTYTNKAFETLMIGQYSLKAVNKNGEALPIYYFNPENDPEVDMYPVAVGDSCTGAVGFILGADDTQVTIIYDDNAGKSGTEIAWTVDLK